MSKSTVSTILCQHGIPPYGKSTWRNSGTLHLPADLTAVVALYVNTPQKAMVLCMNGNRHALDAHLAPQCRGGDEERSSRQTREESLAALDPLLGAVGGQPYEWQRYQELLRFLRGLERQFASDVRLHLILDTLGSRSHSKLQRWLLGRPCFLAQVVPPGCDWLQGVRRCLGELRAEGIESQSVAALSRAILEFVWSGRCGPFVWTATVDSLSGSWHG